MPVKNNQPSKNLYYIPKNTLKSQCKLNYQCGPIPDKGDEDGTCRPAHAAEPNLLLSQLEGSINNI